MSNDKAEGKREYTVVLTMDNIYASDPVEAAKIGRKFMRDVLRNDSGVSFDVYLGTLEPGAGENHNRVDPDNDEQVEA